MENVGKRNIHSNPPTVYRDQLLTVQDLIDFKQELISEIKDLLKQHSSYSEKQWLKADEIKKMFRLSSGKLQYLRDKGVIPFKKLGKVTYYDRDKIYQLMESDEFNQNLKLA